MENPGHAPDSFVILPYKLVIDEETVCNNADGMVTDNG